MLSYTQAPFMYTDRNGNSSISISKSSFECAALTFCNNIAMLGSLPCNNDSNNCLASSLLCNLVYITIAAFIIATWLS